jgi:uridine kinase
MTQKTMIIGIAGASGAGKSLLTQGLLAELTRQLGDGFCSVISEDCYYRRRDELSLEQREKVNYDHPESFEFELLARHLEELRAGKDVDVPIYDYSAHNRKSETTRVTPTRLIILEGILIFYRPQLRKLLDLKVFVDVPLDICLTRRIRRDTAERGRTVDSVLTQYEETVRPMYFEFVEPTKLFADLIVPGGGANAAASTVLLDHLLAACRH